MSQNHIKSQTSKSIFEKSSIFIENNSNAFSNVYYPFFTAKCGFKLDLQSKITILKLSHETLRDPLNHDFVELVLQKMVLIVGFLMGIHRD